MKPHIRRVRCVRCGELFSRRRMYLTKAGYVHDECWEQDVRTKERLAGKSNKIPDEDRNE